MPIYDLRCDKCNEISDVMMTMDEYDTWESTECPKCKHELTKKNREISDNISAVYTGPGKGNFNSNDWGK